MLHATQRKTGRAPSGSVLCSPVSSASRVPVPHEYLALARAFRGRIEEGDLVVRGVLERAAGQIIDRSRQHPIQRADTLAGIARKWRAATPDLGRTSLTIERDRKSLRIEEVRLTPSRYRAGTWDDAAQEPGVTVTRLVLAIAPRTKLVLAMTALASASMHALARRFERKRGSASDADLCADLHALGDAVRDLHQPVGSSIDVPVDGGRWSGTLTVARSATGTERILNARTFLYPRL